MTLDDEFRELVDEGSEHIARQQHVLKLARSGRRDKGFKLSLVIWVCFPFAIVLIGTGVYAIVPNVSDPWHWFHVVAGVALWGCSTVAFRTLYDEHRERQQWEQTAQNRLAELESEQRENEALLVGQRGSAE